MKELTEIKYWIFDLDNTLYSGQTKVFSEVDKKMSSFISEKLNVDLIEAKKGVLKQMVDSYDDENASLISVHRVSKEDAQQYGMISTKDNDGNLMKLSNIIEKPKPEDAPSDLGVVGRYVFSNKILAFLEKTKPGAGNEIQLTDAIKAMLSDLPVFAYKFEGTRYDCGDKLGFIKANIEYALKNEKFGNELEEYLKRRLA